MDGSSLPFGSKYSKSISLFHPMIILLIKTNSLDAVVWNWSTSTKNVLFIILGVYYRPRGFDHTPLQVLKNVTKYWVLNLQTWNGDLKTTVEGWVPTGRNSYKIKRVMTYWLPTLLLSRYKVKNFSSFILKEIAVWGDFKFNFNIFSSIYQFEILFKYIKI